MEQLMKFIHVSDVHLGIKPDEGKPWSEKRAQDIWDSFAERADFAAVRAVWTAFQESAV